MGVLGILIKNGECDKHDDKKNDMVMVKHTESVMDKLINTIEFPNGHYCLSFCVW